MARKKARKAPAPKRRTAKSPAQKNRDGRFIGKLTEEAQIFIVQQLAMFSTPQEVAEEVKKVFEVDITRQAVEKYNPTRFAGRGLGEKLTTLFNETRKAWREETANLATAGKAERIRRLERMAEKAEERGNFVLASQLLKQIAEEMGDAYVAKGRGSASASIGITPPGQGVTQPGEFIIRFVDGIEEPEDDEEAPAAGDGKAGNNDP